MPCITAESGRTLEIIPTECYTVIWLNSFDELEVTQHLYHNYPQDSYIGIDEPDEGKGDPPIYRFYFDEADKPWFARQKVLAIYTDKEWQKKLKSLVRKQERKTKNEQK